MQNLVKLIMNSLYGVQIRKNINELYYFKSENWMQTEYDDNVLEYWRLPNGNHFEKITKDEGLHGNKGRKNTMP